MTLEEALERIEKVARDTARSYEAWEVLEPIHTEIGMIRADVILEARRAGFAGTAVRGGDTSHRVIAQSFAQSPDSPSERSV